jgi:hypothetical protein
LVKFMTIWYNICPFGIGSLWSFGIFSRCVWTKKNMATLLPGPTYSNLLCNMAGNQVIELQNVERQQGFRLNRSTDLHRFMTLLVCSDVCIVTRHVFEGDQNVSKKFQCTVRPTQEKIPRILSFYY